MTREEIIKEAIAKIPEPDKIRAKYFVTGVFNYDGFPSLDVIRLVEFEKISNKGVLSWRFKSIT